MVGHHICNEWSLCHYTTINDQNNETHGITKGTILFPTYATNCDGSLARDEDHKTITLTKCCLQTPLVLQMWNLQRTSTMECAPTTARWSTKLTNSENVLTFVHAANAATTRCNDSCILQHALHPTHWTLGSTKSWLNNTTCRSEMFGTLITLTDHKCETAMHDKARITWQNDGHHQPPPIPHNRQNLWNGSTTANQMPQLMNRDGCSAGQTQHHNSQIWNVKKPTHQLLHCMQK